MLVEDYVACLQELLQLLWQTNLEHLALPSESNQHVDPQINYLCVDVPMVIGSCPCQELVISLPTFPYLPKNMYSVGLFGLCNAVLRKLAALPTGVLAPERMPAGLAASGDEGTPA